MKKTSRLKNLKVFFLDCWKGNINKDYEDKKEIGIGFFYFFVFFGFVVLFFVGALGGIEVIYLVDMGIRIRFSAYFLPEYIYLFYGLIFGSSFSFFVQGIPKSKRYESPRTLGKSLWHQLFYFILFIVSFIFCFYAFIFIVIAFFSPFG